MNQTTAIYKGKTGRILATYGEGLPIKDQQYLRKAWHMAAPDARWLRVDEVGWSIQTEVGEVATLPGDYKLLVLFAPEDLAALHF